MAQSKNNLSMINILFFLAISLPQASANDLTMGYLAGQAGNLPCSRRAQTSECCVAAQLWNKLTRNRVYIQNHDDCCGKSSSIPGLECDQINKVTKFKEVTKLNWKDKGLVGKLLPEIKGLKNLQELDLSGNKDLIGNASEVLTEPGRLEIIKKIISKCTYQCHARLPPELLAISGPEAKICKDDCMQKELDAGLKYKG